MEIKMKSIIKVITLFGILLFLITGCSSTFQTRKVTTSGFLGGATNGWEISSGKITAIGTGVIETDGTLSTGVKIATSGIKGYNALTVQTVEIATDGSGWLGLVGTKGVSWNTSGTATIGGWTASATTLANGTDIILDASNKRISINSAPSTADLSDPVRLTCDMTSLISPLSGQYR